MRLLICAGGTGGGVYPALSVLQALLNANEAKVTAVDEFAAGLKPSDAVLWIGGERGMEADLVKREGVPYKAIPAAGVHGVGMRALPGNLKKLMQGFLSSRQILSQFNPDVVLFTGGYVGVPMALAAHFPSKGQPRPRKVVFVPDIEPGLALKLLVRLADRVAVSVEDSRSYLPASANVNVTGYPVRAGLKRVERSEACRFLGLDLEQPVFLVWGGSKGARSINRALLRVLPQLLNEMQIVHLSGQLDWQEVEENRQSLSPEQLQHYRAFPYLHEEMGMALSAADLVLSRAGASSLGELTLFGLPAILVPYPYAWRYQVVNANYLVRNGAAVLLRDADLAEQMVPLVKSLMGDGSKRQEMRQAMLELARPQAANSIAKIISDMGTKRH